MSIPPEEMKERLHGLAGALGELLADLYLDGKLDHMICTLCAFPLSAPDSCGPEHDAKKAAYEAERAPKPRAKRKPRKP